MNYRSKRGLSLSLAGLVVAGLAAALGLAAARAGYRAGTARSGGALALALDDRRGHLAVIAQADFAVTRAFSDLVAAQAMKSYALERGGILLRGAAGAHAGTPDDRQDLMDAMAAALGRMEPARILFDGSAVAVTSSEGRCLATLSAARLAFEGCGAGEAVRGPIRTAFQMVEPAHGLEQRAAPAGDLYPVDAIALGDRVRILALGGPAPPGIGGPGIVVLPFSNDNAAPPDDSQMRAAIRAVLARVGRR